MKEDITPEKIHQYYVNGELSNEDAVDLLISLINRSEDGNVRATSIDILHKLGSKNDFIFKILERTVHIFCNMICFIPYVRFLSIMESHKWEIYVPVEFSLIDHMHDHIIYSC